MRYLQRKINYQKWLEFIFILCSRSRFWICQFEFRVDPCFSTSSFIYLCAIYMLIYDFILYILQTSYFKVQTLCNVIYYTYINTYKYTIELLQHPLMPVPLTTDLQLYESRWITFTCDYTIWYNLNTLMFPVKYHLLLNCIVRSSSYSFFFVFNCE